MNKTKFAAICILASTLALSGCVARTYNLTRDRVDQDLSSTAGNRGYIMGQAPEDTGERKSTRTTRVFEVELGFKKSTAKCPSITPMIADTQETVFSQETASDFTASTDASSEQYTVGKNDTLQKISKKFYGTTKKWPAIYNANKNVLRAPDKLYPGQILNIPAGSELKTEAITLAEPKENLK